MSLLSPLAARPVKTFITTPRQPELLSLMFDMLAYPIEHQVRNLQIVFIEHEHVCIAVNPKFGKVHERDVTACLADARGEIAALLHRRRPA